MPLLDCHPAGGGGGASPLIRRTMSSRAKFAGRFFVTVDVGKLGKDAAEGGAGARPTFLLETAGI
jgi:hypothetical protein